MACKKKNSFFVLFIPRHTVVAGYYGFTLDVPVSVRLSEPIFQVKGLNFVTTLYFIPLRYIISLWVRELIALKPYGNLQWDIAPKPELLECPSVRFSFPDDNLSKHQWIFTKLRMCVDTVEIWFGIANGQISSNFYGVICPKHAHIFSTFLSWTNF